MKVSFLCQFGKRMNFFCTFETKKRCLKKLIIRFFFLRVKCFAVFPPEVTRNEKWPEKFLNTVFGLNKASLLEAKQILTFERMRQNILFFRTDQLNIEGSLAHVERFYL